MGVLILPVTAIAVVILFLAYLCYRFAFYVAPRVNVDRDAITIPEGEIYEAFRDQMVNWVKEIRAIPHEDFEITSFDGLKLCGKFYEYVPGAPMELMFHGYRGGAERDLSGGVHRCFQLGRSALIVDQRCSGDSEGNVITFGIKEYRDCLAWTEFAISHFGPDVKIILTGISMGASTVLMAAGQELPSNVIGILADCGFNSARDVICSVIRKMRLPPVIGYPLVKLGAKIFGHFNLDAYSAEAAMKTCKVPVIFFHGDQDDLVPYEMSRINFDACGARKQLVIIPGAGHGLSFPVAPDAYLNELWEFFGADASHPSAWPVDTEINA